MSRVLSDVGEFALLARSVIPAFDAEGLRIPIGDDCAFVPIPGGTLVVTTDAAPRPLVFDLGIESYWSWGWYSVLINASDLAAAGARPLAFTSSVEAPSSMLVDEFEEFFAGMAAACKRFALPNAGGNIRTAPRFACHGTALGLLPEDCFVTRRECRPGDYLIAIGPCGRFASAYLQARRIGFDSLPPDEKARLFTPEPQLVSMRLLRERALIAAASDNSDGVLGAIANIATASDCAVELLLDDLVIAPPVLREAETSGYDPLNLFLFWGDWQVICSIREGDFRRFRDLIREYPIEWTSLGRAVPGDPAIYGVRDGQRRRMRMVRNENFTPDSFNMDVRAHVEHMLTTDLFAD